MAALSIPMEPPSRPIRVDSAPVSFFSVVADRRLNVVKVIIRDLALRQVQVQRPDPDLVVADLVVADDRSRNRR